MNVTLIHKTNDAQPLLLFTKNTRLQMTPGGIDEIRSWPQDRIEKELAYMATTIKSSWEFLHVTFLTEGLSRAGAQQMTRSRHASYAMQSQRVTDVRTMGVVPPDAPFKTLAQAEAWGAAISSAKGSYAALVDSGFPVQDARGILPINIECNIVSQYNLRDFTDLVKARSSLRVQGEYGRVVAAMRARVLEAWPWTAPFFESAHAQAIQMIEAVARELGITPGAGPGWQLAKAADLLRGAD